MKSIIGGRIVFDEEKADVGINDGLSNIKSRKNR